MTDTMLAAVARRYGGPEVVRIEEVPRPAPGPGEVLIRVHASTVNRTDCGFRAASPFVTRFFTGLSQPRNPVWGSELAGEVVQLGAGVSTLGVGDRVFAFCDSRFGGHAQYATFRESEMIETIPEGTSYAEAAAILEGAHYALFHIRDANIGPSSRVMLNGATGAIGSAALQLMKHLGAHVVATCPTKHVDVIRSLGADRVIDYENEDFTQCGDHFDMVFDSVGKSTFGLCKGLLRPGGAYSSSELGPYGQNPIWSLFKGRLGGKKVLFPLPKNLKSDASYLRDLVARSIFRPLIDRSYPLDQIADAYRYVETGMKVGNVIIEIP